MVISIPSIKTSTVSQATIFLFLKYNGSLQNYLIRWAPIHPVDEPIFALTGEDYDPLLGAWL